MATPTMPSGSSIRRLAKYSHDTADGDADAITAPASTSNCGPALAIMPGTALPRKPRIGGSNEIRNGVARLPARLRHARTSNCNSPAKPTVAAMTSAASAASCRQHQQRRHHRDQRDVEQQRRERGQRKTALRVQQRHHHGDRPGKGEIGQHQPARRRPRVAASLPANPGASADITSGIARPEQRGRHHQRGADGAEHAARKRRGRGRALGLAHAQPGRHQRRVQRALGQQPSHHIDPLERDQERIGDGPRAEQRRHASNRAQNRAAARPAFPRTP